MLPTSILAGDGEERNSTIYTLTERRPQLVAPTHTNEIPTMGFGGRPVSPRVALIGVDLGNRFNIRCSHGCVVPASDEVLGSKMVESQCLGWDFANDIVGVGDTEGGIRRLVGNVLHQLHVSDPRLAVIDLAITVSI